MAWGWRGGWLTLVRRTEGHEAGPSPCPAGHPEGLLLDQLSLTFPPPHPLCPSSSPCPNSASHSQPPSPTSSGPVHGSRPEANSFDGLLHSRTNVLGLCLGTQGAAPPLPSDSEGLQWGDSGPIGGQGREGSPVVMTQLLSRSPTHLLGGAVTTTSRPMCTHRPFLSSGHQETRKSQAQSCN